jgi:uncharacterized protein (TIGR02147 family)
MDRPVITTYQSIAQFVADMLAFKKAHEADFSVLQACRSLRRISPALVTLIVKGQRRVTMDRVDEISKLLGLTPHERQYLKDWTSGLDRTEATKAAPTSSTVEAPRRKLTSSHILTDWMNVFVKDAFDLEHIRKKPDEIYALLGGIASQKRVDQSIKFLLKHGYLRKTNQGDYVPEAPLHSVDQKLPNEKVRKFHKAVLKNAQEAIDTQPTDKRYANALVLSLNQETYARLIELIAEQAESLQSFAEDIKGGNMLYQLVINVSPTGGQRDK